MNTTNSSSEETALRTFAAREHERTLFTINMCRTSRNRVFDDRLPRRKQPPASIGAIFLRYSIAPVCRLVAFVLRTAIALAAFVLLAGVACHYHEDIVQYAREAFACAYHLAHTSFQQPCESACALFCQDAQRVKTFFQAAHSFAFAAQ
jgi:hypothetical protein